MAKLRCDSCEVAIINGIRCHETGCPEAWRDARPVCNECGSRFVPEARGQTECSPECFAAYRGLPCPEEFADDGADLDDDDTATAERFARHRAADPHCTCPDCTEYHFATVVDENNPVIDAASGRREHAGPGCSCEACAHAWGMAGFPSLLKDAADLEHAIHAGTGLPS